MNTKINKSKKLVINIIDTKKNILHILKVDYNENKEVNVFPSNNLIFIDESKLRSVKPYIILENLSKLKIFPDKNEFHLLYNWASCPSNIDWNKLNTNGIPFTCFSNETKNISLSSYIFTLLDHGILRLVKDNPDIINPTYFKASDKYKVKYQPAGFPRMLFLLLTSRCNLNCKHCFINANTYKNKEKNQQNELTTEEVKSLLDYCDEYGLQTLDFGGGEPTLRNDFIEILLHAIRKKFAVTISSNGMFDYDKLKQIIYLLKRRRERDLSIQFSLDGAKADTHDYLRGMKGCFDHLMDIFQNFKSNNVSFTVETSLYKKNITELEDIIDICLKYKVKMLTVHPIKQIGRADENLLLDFENIKKSYNYIRKLNKNLPIHLKYNVDYLPIASFISNSYRQLHLLKNMDIRKYSAPDDILDDPVTQNTDLCTAGMTSVCIDPFGNVIPCAFAYGYSNFTIGNIRNDRLLEIWKLSEWDIYRGKWDIEDLNICSKCHWISGCGAYICRILPAITLNDFYGPSPYCIKAKSNLEIEELVDTYLNNRQRD